MKLSNCNCFWFFSSRFTAASYSILWLQNSNFWVLSPYLLFWDIPYAHYAGEGPPIRGKPPPPYRVTCTLIRRTRFVELYFVNNRFWGYYWQCNVCNASCACHGWVMANGHSKRTPPRFVVRASWHLQIGQLLFFYNISLLSNLDMQMEWHGHSLLFHDWWYMSFRCWMLVSGRFQ